MDSTPFALMQQAVDIVSTSLHPTNKIAATIAGDGFALSRVNYWPRPILEKIGMEPDIGNSSGTVHAETACIQDAPMTEGASLFVTDPPCPNCVKNMAEAGIKNLYIDHKGFDKDFAVRRGDDIRTMSMEIAKHAGISVFKIYRKEKRIETIFEIPKNYVPPSEKPARVLPLHEKATSDAFRQAIANEGGFYKGRPYAVAFATGPMASVFLISAEVHAITGYTSKTAPEPEGKYSYLLQPVHRVLMTAAQKGLKIDRGYLFSSRIPTARELVNVVGAGFERLWLGDDHQARDEHGIAALKILMGSGILKTMNPD